MTKKGTSQSCLVCGDVSKTIRFGAVSCHACGEFFRRKVLQKTRIPKRCDGNCRLSKTIRKTCQSCRYQKCRDSGMKEILVKSRIKTDFEDSTSSSSILKELEEGYQKLQNSRVRVFGDQKESRFCTNEEFNKICEIDMKLIFNYIISIFQSKMSIGKDQEQILTDNFILPFVKMETTFRSTGASSYYLPDGNMFNPEHLEKLYMDQQKIEDPDGLHTLRIVQPYWNFSTRNLRVPMDLVKPDRAEMLLLSALIYWDFGIQEQSEDCIQKCLQMRQLVLRELSNYEKRKVGEDNCELRIIDVVGILHGLHKASGAIRDCGHLTKIFNLRGKECPLYETMDN